MVDVEKEKKFCGNCCHHSPYEYPINMFCTTRYVQNKNPIVNTLWCCDDWNQIVQRCHCVRDALKKKNGKYYSAKVIT